MRVNVTVRDRKPSPRLIDAIKRRLDFALGRFDKRITKADVILSDVNGPRGGVDQHCRLRVTLPARAVIITETTAAEPLDAVGGAADRAFRRVREAFGRKRDRIRRSGSLRAETVERSALG